MSTLCYNCSAPIAENNLGRQDLCEKCGRSTRVCRNCRHYDVHHNNMCREEQAQRVVDKEKSNFCEWFQARDGGVGGQAVSKESLKSAADSLFKKK